MAAAITIEVLQAGYGDALWIECARDGRPWRMLIDGGPPEAYGRPDPAARRIVCPGAPELPLDPEFIDDLADADPVDSLSGELARVWAPFIVIGV